MAAIPQASAGRHGAVRITIPASVAYDLGAFQKGIAAIAERLGCAKCVSGVDCTFQLERAFLINEALEVRALGPSSGPVSAPQDPIPSLASGDPDGAPARTVTAVLAPAVGGDLRKLQQAVARVAGRLGCEACCSGFDITFRNERAFLVNENLQVNALGAVR